jgi:hypothetical protein
MDARDKLMAEAGLTETKNILCWDFDFRRLRISVPKNKFIAWTTNISTLLVKGTTTAKELKSMIRHLGHLALVVPGVQHFLSHLQELQLLATHCCSIHINESCWKDLMLMLHFLDITQQRIDTNLIAF